MVVPLPETVIKFLHIVILTTYPDTTSGYMQESMIGGCMDYAMTKTFGYEPFKDLITKASVLLHSIITFHPFVDGNKRTALLATFFFLLFNGYHFHIPLDAADFTRQIALEKIPKIEIVAAWLSKNVRKRRIAFAYRLLFGRMSEEYALAFCLLFLSRRLSWMLRSFKAK